MSRSKTIIVASLFTGIAIGFLLTFVSTSNNIKELRGIERELTSANVSMENELAELRMMENESDLLKAEMSKLLLGSASGGGVNMKMMPHPVSGELSVKLPEVFSFDANHAFCRVETNPEPFILPTYKMGDVLIEKNDFFMSMSTTSIEEFKLSKGHDGKNKVTITGGLDCFTEVAQANMKIGSREAAELAEYKIEATDGGLGGGIAGDTFEFTVYFDPEIAPVNYGIFGPEFTFTGDMVEGEITIPSSR